MSRSKNALTEDGLDKENEMAPGSGITADDLDDFDPGMLLGLNNVVPALPNIPGFHCSWAAVPSDAVNDSSRWIKSLMLGYRPITPAEFEQYAPFGCAASEITEVRTKNNHMVAAVRVMDVVAVKIPMERHVAITKYLQDQVLRTEADIQRRPVSNFRDTRYSQIEIEGRPHLGHSTNVQDALDKI